MKSSSYFLESVKRELLDLALQMQQPCDERYTFGLWNENILSSFPLVVFFCCVFFGVKAQNWRITNTRFLVNETYPNDTLC